MALTPWPMWETYSLYMLGTHTRPEGLGCPVSYIWSYEQQASNPDPLRQTVARSVEPAIWVRHSSIKATECLPYRRRNQIHMPPPGYKEDYCKIRIPFQALDRKPFLQWAP